jgi:hypothetical protein
LAAAEEERTLLRVSEVTTHKGFGSKLNNVIWCMPVFIQKDKNHISKF